MTLHEFLKTSDLSGREFAKRIGTSESVLSRLVQRKRAPSFEVARKIIAASDGLVTVDDLALTDAEAA